MIQPNIIDIEITNMCNQECRFCLRSGMKRPVKTMSLSCFKKIIDELARFDFPSWGKVVLAGFGEPTLHPQFAEAAEYAGSQHLPIRIYTNGTKLDQKTRQALIHPGITSLKLSINVHGADMFARVTKNKIAWDIFVKGIVRLLQARVSRSAGPEITLQLLYTADLPEHVKQYEVPVLDSPEMALKAIRFWQVQCLNIAKDLDIPVTMKPAQESEIKSGTVFELFENTRIKLCRYLPYRTHFDPFRDFPSGLNFQNCTRHFNNMVIFSDGSCTPCCTDVNCQMFLGNVADSSVKEVFNSPVAVRNREEWSAGRSPHELCQICLD
jgi:MoaA/NifB/PqqE/SkfB family radical SAM enzyme